MTLTEFLLARIAEDEAVARSGEPTWLGDPGLRVVAIEEGSEGEIIVSPARLLAECAAYRAIVELHKAWPVLVDSPPTFEHVGGGDINTMTFRASRQVAWLTEQEYRTRFGDEPPAAPMIRALAAIYADHPDYRDEWLL